MKTKYHNQLWIDLLDRLKALRGFATDRELALFFNVTHPMISIIRSGTQDMPTSMKIVLKRELGYMSTCRDALFELKACLPKKLADEILLPECCCNKDKPHNEEEKN